MTIDNLLEIYMDAESNVSLSIRGQRVMLDRDLAEMYGVETRVLNQAVKRNKDCVFRRYPFTNSDDTHSLDALINSPHQWC